MTTLHLFPNGGQLHHTFSFPKDSKNITLDLDINESIDDIMVYDQKIRQLTVSNNPESAFGELSMVTVNTKKQEVITGRVIADDNGLLTLLVAAPNGEQKIVHILKYDTILSNSISKKINIEMLDDTDKVHVITKLKSYHWEPKYTLMVRDGQLVNFSFGAEIDGNKFLINYRLNDIYLHTKQIQERSYKRRTQRYDSESSHFPAMMAARSSSESSDLEVEKMDLMYNISHLKGSVINSLNSFQISQLSHLDDFKEIYIVDVFNRNDKVYRAYKFEDKTTYPDGSVTVMDDTFNIIGIGSMKSYLNEKLITVIQEENIKIAVEVSSRIEEVTTYDSEESQVYNEKGYNVAGKSVMSSPSSINRSTSPGIASSSVPSSVSNSVPRTSPKTTVNGNESTTDASRSNIPSSSVSGSVPRSAPKTVVNGNGLVTKGGNNVPVKNPKSVPKLIENTPAPESFKEGEKMREDSEKGLLLSGNKYFDKSKIKERVHVDLISIKLQNMKNIEVTIQLMYEFNGTLKKFEPEALESRPGSLIWEVVLDPEETRIFHGAVKYGEYLGY